MHGLGLKTLLWISFFDTLHLITCVRNWVMTDKLGPLMVRSSRGAPSAGNIRNNTAKSFTVSFQFTALYTLWMQFLFISAMSSCNPGSTDQNDSKVGIKLLIWNCSHVKNCLLRFYGNAELPVLGKHFWLGQLIRTYLPPRLMVLLNFAFHRNG